MSQQPKRPPSVSLHLDVVKWTKEQAKKEGRTLSGHVSFILRGMMEKAKSYTKA